MITLKPSSIYSVFSPLILNISILSLSNKFNLAQKGSNYAKKKGLRTKIKIKIMNSESTVNMRE